MWETWETWVGSLGQEDPLEEEMAAHSSILVWKIPWVEESGGLQSMGSQGVRHDWVRAHTHMHIYICNKAFGTDTIIYPFRVKETKAQKKK